MYMKKLSGKLIYIILCMSICLGLCSCAQSEETIVVADDVDHIIYYTIGTVDPDLSMVEDALNEILRERYDLTIDYRKVAWSDYDNKITQLVNAGDNFDIAFVAGKGQGDYAGWAKKGAWLPLDTFLCNDGKDLYRMISPVYWKGATVEGHIYGIPTNKEIATPNCCMFPKELVEKYNIDITKITSLEDLREPLRIIKENEPEYIPLQLDKNSYSLFGSDGYEYVIGKEGCLMVRSDDKDLKVVDIFETDLCKEKLDLLREYYLAGYINEDAPIRTSTVLKKGEKVFCKMSYGGPYSDSSWSADRGYEVVSTQIDPSIATTESTRGALMVVNALTEKADACYRFLNAVNTDPEVRNMLNYGIQNEHYILDANEQVIRISDNYLGVQYTQGNWFILNTRQGEPRNKWQIYEEFNNSVMASELLGFEAELSKHEKQVNAVAEVWSYYYPALMTGAVDVDTYLPMFVEDLKKAGIDELRDEIQSQIDAWKMQ